MRRLLVVCLALYAGCSPQLRKGKFLEEGNTIELTLLAKLDGAPGRISLSLLGTRGETRGALLVVNLGFTEKRLTDPCRKFVLTVGADQRAVATEGEVEFTKDLADRGGGLYLEQLTVKLPARSLLQMAESYGAMGDMCGTVFLLNREQLVRFGAFAKKIGIEAGAATAPASTPAPQ